MPDLNIEIVELIGLNKQACFTIFLSPCLQGANSYGQLGLGHKQDVLLPQALQEFAGSQKALRNIAGGGGHSAVITGNKSTFMFSMHYKP